MTGYRLPTSVEGYVLKTASSRLESGADLPSSAYTYDTGMEKEAIMGLVRGGLRLGRRALRGARTRAGGMAKKWRAGRQSRLNTRLNKQKNFGGPLSGTSNVAKVKSPKMPTGGKNVKVMAQQGPQMYLDKAMSLGRRGMSWAKKNPLKATAAGVGVVGAPMLLSGGGGQSYPSSAAGMNYSM